MGKILRFWYKIKGGFFFAHLIESAQITRNDQLCICAMIVNMMLDDEAHPRYDSRIPPYMQLLFNECVESNTLAWIVKSEQTKMISKLQNLLSFDHRRLSASSQFVQYLSKYKKCNVCNANIFDWTIAGAEFESLFAKTQSGSSGSTWLCSPCLKFHFECQNKAKNDLFRVRIHLDSKPDAVAKINLGMGLFCAAANDFDNYSYGELRHDKLYNVSLHSLFPTALLRQNCADKRFTLKLQIQLFHVYDFDGKLLPINQSTLRPVNVAPAHQAVHGHGHQASSSASQQRKQLMMMPSIVDDGGIPSNQRFYD